MTEAFAEWVTEAFATKYSQQMHEKIPGMLVGKFVHNLASCIKESTAADGKVPVGDVCTGTGA